MAEVARVLRVCLLLLAWLLYTVLRELGGISDCIFSSHSPIYNYFYNWQQLLC